MANIYDKYILLKMVNWACQQKPSMIQRTKIIPLAKGDILEIAIGSGLNLPYYDENQINSLTGLEPSSEIWELKKYKIENLKFKFNYIKAYAEEIPLKNNSFDYVVITYSLCTIKNTVKALTEISRVLKPKGKLLFCEHGLAPDKNVRFWQNTINPIWKKVSGGCNLNKNIPRLIRENGFNIISIDKIYIPGWKPASFNYWGVAVLNNEI
jgi:ubiquinone/menaquinone biosynthesis C-methylase UbiE